MRVNIYIADESSHIWAKAKQLAVKEGKPISTLILEWAKEYVLKAERQYIREDHYEG